MLLLLGSATPSIALLLAVPYFVLVQSRAGGQPFPGSRIRFLAPVLRVSAIAILVPRARLRCASPWARSSDRKSRRYCPCSGLQAGATGCRARRAGSCPY